MNGNAEAQLHLDFRTGRPTFIVGPHVAELERAACSALNRQRTRGIQEATRPASPGEPVPPDGWAAHVARSARQWGVPLIPLSVLGISFDEDGLMQSSLLSTPKTGAEATAWMDHEHGCVYKLFDLKQKGNEGALGKKLRIETEASGELRVVPCDAYLSDTLEKLCLLHEVGACPTEIVGLAETGDYLIAKQPFCHMHGDSLLADTESAVRTVRAVAPTASLGNPVWVFCGPDGQPWLLGDLHKGNIRRDAWGKPTIIDALVGPLPPVVVEKSVPLQRAVRRAAIWRTTGTLPTNDPFSGVLDSEL